MAPEVYNIGRCIVCASRTKDVLCKRCSQYYIYDKKLEGARLRKRFKKTANRRKFAYKGEITLYRILRKVFDVVYRDFRPTWAPSPKNVCLEYDICIPSEKILIEVDGPYHWKRSMYKTEEEWEYRQLCDRLKEQHALENGWQLSRINLSEEKITKRHIHEILGLPAPKSYKLIKRIRRF